MQKKIDYGDNVIKKNAVLSLIYKIASAGLSLISAPLLLHCLGENKYGIRATLMSLISWIYYCDLGIGNGLRNKLAASLVIRDYEKSRKFIGISYVVVTFMSILVFGIVLIFIYCLDVEEYLNLEITDENIKLCLLIAFLIACINFVTSLANNMLYALQKASMVSLFGVIGQLLFIVSLVMCLVTGKKWLLIITFTEGCTQFIKNIIETIYVFKKNPELKFGKKDIEFKYTKEIMSFGVQMFIVQIAALVLNSTDNIIITRIMGVTAVTPYSFCYTYFSMINTFYVALITPFLSAYTAAYTLHDIVWIKRTIKKNVWVYIVFVIGTIFATLFFKPFTIVWLQKELYFEKGLVLTSAFYFILLMFNHIFSTFLTGIGRIKETMIATSFGTILNIPISVFLARNLELGVTGVVLGSVISLLVGVWVTPLVMLLELNRFKEGEKKR